MQTSQSPATKAFARTMVIANSQPLVRSNPSLGTDRSRMVASVDPCGPIDPFVHPRPLQHPHSSVGCHPHYGPLPPALSVPRGPSLPPPLGLTSSAHTGERRGHCRGREGTTERTPAGPDRSKTGKHYAPAVGNPPGSVCGVLHCEAKERQEYTGFCENVPTQVTLMLLKSFIVRVEHLIFVSPWFLPPPLPNARPRRPPFCAKQSWSPVTFSKPKHAILLCHLIGDWVRACVLVIGVPSATQRWVRSPASVFPP